MAKKPDIPCAHCGKLLWSGPRSLPGQDRMCRSCRAEAAAQPIAPPTVEADAEVAVTVREPAADFGPRGRRLWEDMTSGGKLTSALDVVLLEEACRLADRLDRLDAFLRGREDAWLRFHARNEDGSIVRVVVDRALTEAREQASTLTAIVAKLDRTRSGESPKTPEVNPLDEFTRRRSERRRAAGL